VGFALHRDGGRRAATACRELGERARRIGAFLLQAEPEQVKLDRGRVVGPAGEVALSEIASTWYRFPQNLPAGRARGRT